MISGRAISWGDYCENCKDCEWMCCSENCVNCKKCEDLHNCKNCRFM